MGTVKFTVNRSDYRHEDYRRYTIDTNYSVHHQSRSLALSSLLLSFRDVEDLLAERQMQICV